MELCHQDLVKALTANHRHMTEADILRIFQQVALGLSYMHTQNPPVAHWYALPATLSASFNSFHQVPQGLFRHRSAAVHKNERSTLPNQDNPRAGSLQGP